MQKIKISPFILITIISFAGLYYLNKRKDNSMPTPDYINELDIFRKKSEDRLKSPDGWLSVVGLYWLNEGQITIGSANENKVILPNSAPEKLGVISLNNKAEASIKFTNNQAVTLDEAPVKLNTSYILRDDSSEEPTKIKVGAVSFFLIKRKNGVGVRIKDTQAEARLKFKSKEWFPPQKDFIITADWIPHIEPKKILVPDVIGNLNEELSPGFARFQFNGETVELHPTLEGDLLFFVFRDQTSGRETYGASRFLYTDQAKNGKLLLDFNKAVNPPCAFTKYATCPMPPLENIMKIAIGAGEKAPLESGH